MKIYLNNDSTVIPKGETCYIIAKDGIYLQKKLDLVESITPVDSISFLNEISTFAKLKIPKMNSQVFAKIVDFFKDVYELYRTESMILLFYNRHNNKYKIYVPNQTVTSASITYDSDVTIDKYILVGSIHSHGSMSAFHSSIDVGDEQNFDGIHITVGNLTNKDKIIDICSSISINGMRVPVLPEDYINGIIGVEYSSFFTNMFRPNFELINNEKVYSKSVKTTKGYIVSILNNKKFNNKEWLSKISTINNNNNNNKIQNHNLQPNNSMLIDFRNMNSNNYNNKDEICNKCVYRDIKLKKELLNSDENNENNFKYDYPFDIWGDI
jgi:PRTRC genetic system protein A